jgi:4-amino-4-deoxy-L-arabinose transferase-like glycosyltransferase
MTRYLGIAALIIYYLGLVAAGGQRHLWHDELYTFYIAQAPSLSELWQDLGLDLNPPLGYLLARVAMRLFGNTAFAVRLPSMAGVLTGSLCLYAVVTRRLRPSYGLLAVLIFWSTPALYFATEARPYGLVLGFFGLAMLCWQRAGDSPRPAWAVPTMACAVSGMMLSHFFAVFFLTPFLLAEVIRLIRSRRLDWAIAAALLTPCVLPLFFLHIQTGGAFPPAFQAGLRKMASYYYWTLHPEGWVMLLGLCIALASRRSGAESPAQAEGPPPAELAFVAGLLALPITVNVAMMITHGAFFTRYAAPTLFAYPLVLVFLLATSRGSAPAMCGLLALYIPIQNLAKPRPQALQIAQVHPELPLVAASGLTFLEMDHYEPPETVDRLYYLTDREHAVQDAHATLFEGVPTIKQHFPIRARIEPFRDFVQSHPRFLVLGTPDYPEDWLLRYLLAIHARLEFLGEFPSEYKDRQLFVAEVEEGDRR